MTALFETLPEACEFHVPNAGVQCGTPVETRESTYHWGLVNGTPELTVLCDLHAEYLHLTNDRLTEDEIRDLRVANLPEGVVAMSVADWRDALSPEDRAVAGAVLPHVRPREPGAHPEPTFEVLFEAPAPWRTVIATVDAEGTPVHHGEGATS